MTKSNQDWAKRVEQIAHTRLNDCYQCGKCTAGCPRGDVMDMPPTRIMRATQTGDILGAARAARYPSVNLAAGASVSSDSLSDWSDALKTLSFGPSVSLPLFQGGALAAAEARARANAEEALFAYRDAVLGAVHEAQRGWTDLASERARTADLEEAVRANEEALRAAQELYRAGKGDYTSVLVRRTAWLSARLALAQNRASLADLSLSLFKALGGSP